MGQSGNRIIDAVSGVYLSYPFCAQKCTYCNFASGVLPKALEAEYRDALLREIEAADFQWMPDTVYVGGGTPSAMDPDDLGRVLGAIPGRPWREATLEASPGTLTRERVSAWRHAGVNRVSLGVQSLVQQELARTGTAAYGGSGGGGREDAARGRSR